MIPSSPYPIVVIVTLGGNDLQFLVKHNGKLKRASPRNTGEVHRALRNGKNLCEWWLPATIASEVEELKEHRYRFNPMEGFKPEVGGNADSTRASEVRLADFADLGLPEAKISSPQLIPGILWRDLLTLRNELRNRKVRLCRFLLIHTDRDAENRWANEEPSATAPLLAAWLPGWLGVPAGTVEVISALRGMEELHVKNEQGAVFLLPEAGERIDRSLRTSADRFPGSTARLHDAGGMPAIVEATRASTRLNFSTIEYRTPPDGHAANLRTVAGLRHTVVETMEARRRVLDLIHRGQFLIASGLATGFDSDGPESTWVRVLAAIGCYIQGYMTKTRELAKKLVGTHSQEVLEAISGGEHIRSLHVALRADAALRAEDYLGSATLTGTFFEVALFDAVDQCLRRREDESCINWVRKTVRSDKWALKPRDLIRLGNQVQAQSLSWLRMELANVAEWSRRSQLLATDREKKHILIEAVREKDLWLGDSLFRLSEQLNTEDAQENILGEFRNKVVHSLPPESEIKKSAQLFVDRRVWAELANGRKTFLEQCVPADVLHALGVTEPGRFYDELVTAVVRDVLRHPTKSQTTETGEPL